MTDTIVGGDTPSENRGDDGCTFRDLIVVRNCVMLLAAMVVIVNFVVDVLYATIDPRVKASDI